MKLTEDTNKWKDTLCSWIRRVNIITMSTLLKATCRFNAAPIKIPVAFSHRLNKQSWSSYEARKRLNSQWNLDKEQHWRLTLPGFKLYYKTTVIKTVWYWHKNRHRSMKQNQKPMHTWSTNIRQGDQEYLMKENIVSSINSAGIIGYSHAKNETRPLS